MHQPKPFKPKKKHLSEKKRKINSEKTKLKTRVDLQRTIKILMDRPFKRQTCSKKIQLTDILFCCYKNSRADSTDFVKLVVNPKKILYFSLITLANGKHTKQNVGTDFLPDRIFTRKVITWTFYQTR